MMIAIDTETYEKDEYGFYRPILDSNKFVLGCAIDETLRERYFYTIIDMLRFILALSMKLGLQGKRLFIYAHNHQYDFYNYMKSMIMKPELQVLLWDPLLAIYNNNTYFLDSMSFYKMPLWELGEMFKLSKLEMPKQIRYIDELKPYIFRDTLIVMKAMLSIKEEIKHLGYNPRKLLTAGQLAITSFQTHLKRENIPISFINHSLKYESKIRQSLRGGRVQAFKKGHFTNVYSYDQNAQHPYIEANMRFPDLETETFIESPPNLTTKLGCTMAKVACPSIRLPFLPITYEEKQVYPTDATITGIWTNEELNYALKMGYKIYDILWTITYEDADNPFRAYQQRLWELRRNAPKAQKQALKLLMNNLGMKFSQRNKNYRYKLVERHKAFDEESQGYRFDGFTGNSYIYKKSMGYSYPRYYAPIISALITANSRIMLYNHLRKIRPQNLLYCDTDSITTIGDQSKALDIGEDWGQWKVTASQGDCYILGEKKYRVNDDIRVSGVPNRHKTRDMVDKAQTIYIDKLISFDMAKKMGDLSLMGTFTKEEVNLANTSKSDIILPQVIEEVYDG